jgi:hypothetical protein
MTSWTKSSMKLDAGVTGELKSQLVELPAGSSFGHWKTKLSGELWIRIDREKLLGFQVSSADKFSCTGGSDRRCERRRLCEQRDESSRSGWFCKWGTIRR